MTGALIIGLMILINYAINQQEPSNFEIYIALLLYIQFFIKHKSLDE